MTHLLKVVRERHEAEPIVLSREERPRAAHDIANLTLHCRKNWFFVGVANIKQEIGRQFAGKIATVT